LHVLSAEFVVYCLVLGKLGKQTVVLCGELGGGLVVGGLLLLAGCLQGGLVLGEKGGPLVGELSQEILLLLFELSSIRRQLLLKSLLQPLELLQDSRVLVNQ